MIGEVIGKCRIDAVIGNGSMGVVYQAHHMALDVPVALKTIQPELGGREDVVRRLSQEAQLAARLRHPNTVRVYDVGEDAGRPYIVMELLEGITLEEYFGGGLGNDLRRFIRIFHTIATALGDAHDKGIVHRDVKPSNVMIVEGDKPMVMDFGIAGALRADNRLTTPGLLMGTPAFMSPEQAAGQTDLDPRTDVYSLGLMMYELLTDVLPHETENVLGLLTQRVTIDVTPISQVRSDVPGPIADVVMRAVARDPALRFANGKEMAAALVDAYRAMYPRITTRGQAAAGQASPVMVLDLPREETRKLVSTVDLRYTDLHAVFRGVEQAASGFGLMLLRYRDVADVLLFSGPELRACFRWERQSFRPVDLEAVYARKDSAESGYVSSWEVSERYFNALTLVAGGEPDIAGLRLAFVKLPELFSFLSQSGEAGVLRLQLGPRVGWVLFRKDSATQFFCGNWLQVGTDDAGQAISRLASFLTRHPLTRLDFYRTTRRALRTQELAIGTAPFESADARVLVEFVVDALQVSGEALHKAFGLGAAPILNKQLDSTAQQHAWLIDGLQLNDRMTLDADELMGCIERLPRTDRRRVVVDAMGSLIAGRLDGIRQTLPTKRKRKKVLKGMLDMWQERQPALATRSLAAPFEAVIQSARQEMV